MNVSIYTSENLQNNGYRGMNHLWWDIPGNPMDCRSQTVSCQLMKNQINDMQIKSNKINKQHLLTTLNI